MSQIVINSYFSNTGVPATGLTPTIRIWEVSGSTYTLIVGTPNGSGQFSDGVMSEVTDGTSKDGFYSFVFSDTIGYDPTKTYLARADGGAALNETDRYQVASTNPALDVTQIADNVWNRDAALYPYSQSSPTMGGTVNESLTNSNALLLNVNDLQTLIDLAIKYQTNRTKIDPVNSMLIVYDNDCTTELRRFQLLDSLGNASVTEVCERKPVSASDGKPTC